MMMMKLRSALGGRVEHSVEDARPPGGPKMDDFVIITGFSGAGKSQAIGSLALGIERN